MELLFNRARFVSLEGEINYKEVLEDFPQAKTIRIMTYNISKNRKFDMLLEFLKKSHAEVELITNIPSRTDKYYSSLTGNSMRTTARKNIEVYLSKLDPNNYTSKMLPYFNFENHAKIIGTENIVYIGSANYSNESKDNIEAGILIEDKQFIEELYANFFDKVKEKSISFFDENFSSFMLFIVSLQAKFCHHYNNLVENLFTDYERTKKVVADTILIDISDLALLYNDLEELASICRAAEDTYDEKNQKYNDSLEELLNSFKQLNIEKLKETISEGGLLYQLVAFDGEEKTNEILQNEYSLEAYDEDLDRYIELALNESSALYTNLYDLFSNESDEFLLGMERILLVLKQFNAFAEKWRANKINPEIDNTY